MALEQRRTLREDTTANEVRALAELPDGTVLEGTVADVSLGGARVNGPAAHLRPGDDIRLIFVFLTDDRVAYDCTVSHTDPVKGAFDVEFRSEPQPVKVKHV